MLSQNWACRNFSLSFLTRMLGQWLQPQHHYSTLACVLCAYLHLSSGGYLLRDLLEPNEAWLSCELLLYSINRNHGNTQGGYNNVDVEIVYHLCHQSYVGQTRSTRFIVKAFQHFWSKAATGLTSARSLIFLFLCKTNTPKGHGTAKVALIRSQMLC